MLCEALSTKFAGMSPTRCMFCVSLVTLLFLTRWVPASADVGHKAAYGGSLNAQHPGTTEILSDPLKDDYDNDEKNALLQHSLINDNRKMAVSIKKDKKKKKKK